jgi:hypothetical protein
MTERAASADWRLTIRGKEVFTKPRVSVLRRILLNHWYHHRGQLCVSSSAGNASAGDLRPERGRESVRVIFLPKL